MDIILLGTAAGGGFPQWNCACRPCRAARHDPAAARPRTQSSVAVSADGERWFLINASPDVRSQLALIPGAAPRPSRDLPVEGVLLTDAEIDHTLGLLLLREGRRLPVAASPVVGRILERGGGVLPTVRAFADVPFTPLPPGATVELRDRNGDALGLTVEAFAVAGGPPRFAPDAPHDGAVTGLLVSDGRASCACVPGCGALDARTTAHLAGADLILFDGTFWADDELQSLGYGTRTARAMGHLPISGADGSLASLAALKRRAVYLHINNTNPILLEDSPERRAVAGEGLTVGADGMRFSL